MRALGSFGLGAIGLAALALLPQAGCGGDGDGAGRSSGASTISGNVSSASTAAVPRAERSWLARLGDLLEIPARAWAQVTGLDGIEVTASGGSGAASDVTDESGDFAVGGAPTGDVTVTFRRGNCSASTSLGDVTDGSTIDLEDVDFDCSSVDPERVNETFTAVIRNKPNSPNGNLNVCVASGGRFRTRVVKIQGATFVDATFESLQDGDRIDVTGRREGLGANSALDAETVRLLGPGVDDCLGGATPTPEGTATPEPTTTATVTETPEPTPTETPPV